MNKSLFLALSLCGALTVQAETLDVSRFRYAGPFPVTKPYLVDSLNVNSKAFAAVDMLDWPVATSGLTASPLLDKGQLGQSEGYALHLAAFSVENTRYAEATIKVGGLSSYRLYVDGQEVSGSSLKLTPATHQIIVKYLTEAGKKETPDVKLETNDEGLLQIREDGKNMFTMNEVLHGTRFQGASLSQDGKYMIVSYQTTLPGGKSKRQVKVMEVATGKVLSTRSESVTWMPRSTRYYYTCQAVDGRELVAVDPATGQEDILCEQLPQGSFVMAPTEDFLIYMETQEGPHEQQDIYEILEPDDRIPGWRNRMYLAHFDLKTGVYQPLTFGFRNNYLSDISSDGRYILFTVGTQRLTERPTSLMSVYRMNLQTREVETLVEKDGFISQAIFSPDGKQVLLSGSPEAFDGVGKNVEEGQIPSMYDYQLYSLDIASKKVSPLTRDFNPSVQKFVWSEVDNHIYFTAENKDSVNLFCMNPAKGSIRRLDVPEDNIASFSLAGQAQRMAFYGESATNAQRLYMMNTKNQKTTVVEDLSEKLLADVDMGTCEAWNFVNSRGDTIYGRFYLPPHFDVTRKYPMIVNYYGGCSPTSRIFASRYPHNAYAALGYVVYVVEPSGASGFGQKFSARHVNTWGDYVADDIIEGTKQFVAEHSYVDAAKIGCIGASYGGFMTQYLQTKTDLFAAAISHAGISNITSYWGEGYWGYSYGEVASAHSYPWNKPELYTKHSPLFNAENVHTPLLFLHGSVDTNVPIGESIQMFNALKLLGRETAFVVVDGQDHHIKEYTKRLKWQETIFAWFAKWLQGDESWWNALYAPKNL